jgi:hypothetical protein
MSPERYRQGFGGPAWVSDPYEIKRGQQVMGCSHERHRAMRLALGLHASEGGDVTVTNTETGVEIFRIVED